MNMKKIQKEFELLYTKVLMIAMMITCSCYIEIFQNQIFCQILTQVQTQLLQMKERMV